MANKSVPEDKPHKKEEADLRLEIEKLKNENEKIRFTFDQYKERMGRAVDIKLGSTEMMSEDLNNPCSESKLRDMYMNLDFSAWAKFREQLKVAMKEEDSEFNSNLEKAKRCIKEVLKKAQHDFQDNKKKLKQNFQLNTQNPKTSQFYDLAIHYIQMAKFHEKQMPMPRNTEWKDIPGLQTLAEECYRIVSLMVLHNPPIVLDWDKQGQNIFPPIKIEQVESSATAPTDQNEQCEGNGASVQFTADERLEPETVEEAVSHPQEDLYSLCAQMQIRWGSFTSRAMELLSMIPSDSDPRIPEERLKELKENLIPELKELDRQFQNICTFWQENPQICQKGDAKSTNESQTREQTDSDYGIGSLEMKEISEEISVIPYNLRSRKSTIADRTTSGKVEKNKSPAKENTRTRKRKYNIKLPDNAEQEPGEPETKRKKLLEES